MRAKKYKVNAENNKLINIGGHMSVWNKLPSLAFEYIYPEIDKNKNVIKSAPNLPKSWIKGVKKLVVL